MNETHQDHWRKCSVCKKPLGFGVKYYVCSVSTCNGLRTGYVFCNIQCFESHLPGARHRQAGAIEKHAPSAQAFSQSLTPAPPQRPSSPQIAEAPRPPARIIINSSSNSHPTSPSSNHQKIPREVLIIASRLKEYITARSDYNTSAGVMDVLSEYVRVLCDRAIDNARADGRKTVLDRDFDFLKQR